MPDYRYLIYEIEDNIGRITLNRPEKRNALNAELIAELKEAIPRMNNEPEVRCAILTGAGDKAFSAGADLPIFETLQEVEKAYAYLRNDGGVITRALETAEFPWIAAVKGACVAGGLELALCCDMIVAGDNSIFGVLEINIGLLPGWGGTVRLPRAIPVRKAKELLFTGGTIDAQEALRLGLVNRVVPVDQVDAEAMNLARTIASKSRAAVRAGMNIINNSLTCDSIEAALAIERGTLMTLVGAEETRKYLDPMIRMMREG
ncbi:MAG: enoyl-CoA hydratase/isomerase family protein [Syntrophomonadaceae bacterium]|nr:enoyl-CoA hydratase/isomerase family protein [Syntrophomonadaceae bacterium]